MLALNPTWSLHHLSAMTGTALPRNRWAKHAAERDQKIQSAAIAMQVLLPEVSEEKIQNCLRENLGDADLAWHQLQTNEVAEPPKSEVSSDLGDMLAAIEVGNLTSTLVSHIKLRADQPTKSQTHQNHRLKHRHSSSSARPSSTSHRCPHGRWLKWQTWLWKLLPALPMRSFPRRF